MCTNNNSVQHSNSLVLRKAVNDDKALLFAWSNEKTVRKWSFTKDDSISAYEHSIWFKRIMSNSNIHQYILEEKNIPCGQVRVELKNNCAIIHYSIDYEFRGKNLGTKMLMLVIKIICSEMNVREIHALTIPSNIASNKSLINAGFLEKSLTNNRKTFVYKC